MRNRIRVGVVAALLLALGRCGGDSATEANVPCSTSGAADDALFNQYFLRMALVDGATGLPGQPDAERGERYASTALLELRMDATAPVTIRACVEVRDGSGTIVRDASHSATTGSSGTGLGSFPPNAAGYILRVTVNEKLVKNFPFVTE